MKTPQALARQLQQQFDDKIHFEPLLVDGSPIGLEQAYAVQQALVQARQQRHQAQIAGLKIALNDPAAWQKYGLSEPVYGVLLSHALLPSGATLAMPDYTHLKIEFEVAVRIGRALSGNDLAAVDDVADWIEAVAPAVEILDDRCPAKTQPDVGTLVACNVNNSAVVLGPWQAPVVDFDRRITIRSHDEEIESGTVAAVVNPLASVFWLAKAMAAAGRRIDAGAVLITGNLLTVRFPQAGDRYTFELEGLGAVSFGCKA